MQLNRENEQGVSAMPNTLSYEVRGPDVVFVFGAGASKPDGAPLQNELIPMLFESKAMTDVRASRLGQMITSFIQDHFLSTPTLNNYPSLESVFGFIDYFLNSKEDLSNDYPLTRLADIRESLIKVIFAIIARSRERDSASSYGVFWDQVVRHNTNISIVSLNYDAMLEDSFGGLYHKVGYIDYYIHLMNYDMPRRMRPFFWWTNPRDRFDPFVRDDAAAIKILKLHGSLYWRYCHCCRQVLLTPWDTSLDLDTGQFFQYPQDSHLFPGEPEALPQECPLDKAELQTLIIPPSHFKDLTHPVISQIYTEAIREIRLCQRVVFVGYSFPEADVHLKALFHRASLETKDVVVVDPFLNDTLRASYLSIAPQARFVTKGFEDVVKGDDLMRDLLLLSGKTAGESNVVSC